MNVRAAQEKNTMKIRVFVLCTASMGDPVILEKTIECTKEQYDEGFHYDMAETAVQAEGYEFIRSFDENDEAGRQLIRGDFAKPSFEV